MKKGYQIYIPSYGRAGKVTTDSIIKKSKGSGWYDHQKEKCHSGFDRRKKYRND
jgi:hypothetical protein